MANRKLRALIVGAGNIAAGYDTPDAKDILTHAHAYHSAPDFQLLGFVDKDGEKAQQAAKMWGGKAFSSLNAAFAEGEIDVVSVATPDATHASVLKELAAYSPKLVFCEKPLALSIADADRISALYEKSATTAVQVNYLRRFVPEYRAVKNAIADGQYGKFLAGSGIYVKGFLHNGSHMVDLLRFWLGDIEGLERMSVDTMGAVQEAVDPEMSVQLRLAGGKVFSIQCLPGNPYWMFEMDLLFEKKRLRVQDSGFFIQEYTPLDSRDFPGTVELVETALYPTGLGQAMKFAMENIRAYLLQDEPLLCSLPEAVKTLKACMGQP